MTFSDGNTSNTIVYYRQIPGPYVCPECHTEVCPECNGDKMCSKCGKICSYCNGTGKVHIYRNIPTYYIPDTYTTCTYTVSNTFFPFTTTNLIPVTYS